MTTSTDPTLHGVAENWASTASEVKRAEDEHRRAAERVDALRRRLQTLSEQLEKRVGPNRRTLVFQVAPSEVVLVEYEKGVRLLEAEPKDR